MNNFKLYMHCFQNEDRINMKNQYNLNCNKYLNVVSEIKNNPGTQMLGWKLLTTTQDKIVEDINEFCSKAREQFDDFIVLGVGGSALGAKAIFNALCSTVHNEKSKDGRKAPRFYVLDNVDPIEISEVLEFVDLSKTLVNVVSKSGTTTESMSQFLVFYEAIKKVVGEENVNSHFVFTTDEEKGVLSLLAKEKNIKAFFVPGGVGGRFSVLSPVGLLPACMLNLDIKQILLGAKHMQEQCENLSEDNPAFQKAILEYTLNQDKTNIIVTMPYCSKLREYAQWYAQLLAESIGKEKDRDGNLKNCGLTPVSAVGATDQHSQLQLYMEGPQDKLLVCVKVKEFSRKLDYQGDSLNICELSHLKGVEFGKLINMERKATLCGLAHSGIPFIEIEIENLNEFTLGSLFMFGMYEIAFLGELYNVDAYNQPGVEFGKRVTLANLGIEKYRQYLQSCSFLD